MNLQNTLEYIASVAQNHPLINSSYVGSVYDLNSNTNTKYAVFAVEDIDVTKQSNSLIYNCYLYVVDRVMNDESNTTAVQTMAVNTLQEIINYIEGYSQSLAVSGSYVITPIRQKFSDECAGAYVQLRLVSQNDIGECAFSDDKVVEIFQGKTYLLDNYFTKSETLTLLDGKQDTLIAGDNITIVDNVISATGGGGGGDTIWKKRYNGIANNDNTALTPPDYSFTTAADAEAVGIYDTIIGWENKTIQDTSSTIRDSYILGRGNESHNSYNVAVGFSNIFKGQRTDGYGRGLRDNGFSDTCIIGKQNWMPAEGTSIPSRLDRPAFVVGIGYGLLSRSGIIQTYGGELYVRGINGWNGVSLDGTSHLQGYLSGLDTRITNNTTAISGKQDTISAGNGIDVTNNVVSVDNTIAKKTDVYTKNETDSLLGGKQNTLTAGENIDITDDVISVPQEVYLSSIFSPDYTYGSELSFSARTQTSDSISLRGGGVSADALIELQGGGNNGEAATVYVNAYGYSDANIQLKGGEQTRKSQVNIYAAGYSDSEIQMQGGTSSDTKSLLSITANGGTNLAEIAMRGGDANNLSYINIDSEKFTYNDNDVAIEPIDSAFDSGDTIVLSDNHIYSGSNVASLTINGTNFTGDCLVQFTTGSTTPSVTISGLVFDVLPTFNSNKYYELGIHNGHCLWVEYDS